MTFSHPCVLPLRSSRPVYQDAQRPKARESGRGFFVIVFRRACIDKGSRKAYYYINKYNWAEECRLTPKERGKSRW
jgi:hypothetical protein